MTYNGFKNRYYQEDWIQGEGYEDGSVYDNDDGSWTVYDGKQNFMGKVWPGSCEMAYNGERSPYKDSFLRSALEVLTEG